MKNRPKTMRAFRGEIWILYRISITWTKTKCSTKANISVVANRLTNRQQQCFMVKRTWLKKYLQETNPRKIKKLGDIRESVAWNKQKVTILEEIVLSKAGCCAEFRAEVEVPNVVFVEAVQDPFWGSGMHCTRIPLRLLKQTSKMSSKQDLQPPKQLLP